jgi:uncharacterized membrane protein YgdD (TMEM256/DUF423 family)
VNATARSFLVLAGLLGFVGVALGAFGAHALRRRVPPERLDTFETGVRYLLIHALALAGAAWIAAVDGAGAATLAGWAFVVGVVLFSGSLFLLTLTGNRRWGAVTPLGGLALLLGWAAWIVAAWHVSLR